MFRARRFKHYLFHKMRLHVAVVDVLLETSCFGRTASVSKLALPPIPLPDGTDGMRMHCDDAGVLTSDNRAYGDGASRGTLLTQARASGSVGRAARANLRRCARAGVL